MLKQYKVNQDWRILLLCIKMKGKKQPKKKIKILSQPTAYVLNNFWKNLTEIPITIINHQIQLN